MVGHIKMMTKQQWLDKYECLEKPLPYGGGMEYLTREELEAMFDEAYEIGKLDGSGAFGQSINRGNDE
jgi:hypothetical protein